ncbi:hypothetical protein SVIOM342S_01127 [Streptomyces violaceorubidus]
MSSARACRYSSAMSRLCRARVSRARGSIGGGGGSSVNSRRAEKCGRQVMPSDSAVAGSVPGATAAPAAFTGRAPVASGAPIVTRTARSRPTAVAMGSAKSTSRSVARSVSRSWARRIRYTMSRKVAPGITDTWWMRWFCMMKSSCGSER